MTCSKCKSKGVENQANFKKFWYCRTCKEEIVEYNSHTDLEWAEYQEFLNYIPVVKPDQIASLRTYIYDTISGTVNEYIPETLQE